MLSHNKSKLPLENVNDSGGGAAKRHASAPMSALPSVLPGQHNAFLSSSLSVSSDASTSSSSSSSAPVFPLNLTQGVAVAHRQLGVSETEKGFGEGCVNPFSREYRESIRELKNKCRNFESGKGHYNCKSDFKKQSLSSGKSHHILKLTDFLQYLSSTRTVSTIVEDFDRLLDRWSTASSLSTHLSYGLFEVYRPQSYKERLSTLSSINGVLDSLTSVFHARCQKQKAGCGEEVKFEMASFAGQLNGSSIDLGIQFSSDTELFIYVYIQIYYFFTFFQSMIFPSLDQFIANTDKYLSNKNDFVDISVVQFLPHAVDAVRHISNVLSVVEVIGASSFIKLNLVGSLNSLVNNHVFPLLQLIKRVNLQLCSSATWKSGYRQVVDKFERLFEMPSGMPAYKLKHSLQSAGNNTDDSLAEIFSISDDDLNWVDGTSSGIILHCLLSEHFCFTGYKAWLQEKNNRQEGRCALKKTAVTSKRKRSSSEAGVVSGAPAGGSSGVDVSTRRSSKFASSSSSSSSSSFLSSSSSSSSSSLSSSSASRSGSDVLDQRRSGLGKAESIFSAGSASMSSFNGEQDRAVKQSQILFRTQDNLLNKGFLPAQIARYHDAMILSLSEIFRNTPREIIILLNDFRDCQNYRAAKEQQANHTAMTNARVAKCMHEYTSPVRLLENLINYFGHEAVQSALSNINCTQYVYYEVCNKMFSDLQEKSADLSMNS